MAKSTVKPNYLKGALFSLGGPVVGTILWVIVWEMGFIASLVSFVMAWLTVWLYKKGAGSLDRKALYIILPVILFGVVLSLFASFVADAVNFLMSDTLKGVGAMTILKSSEFWAYIKDNLFHNADLLGSYKGDVFFSVVLAALGAYGTVKEVLLQGMVKPATTKKAE